MVSDAGTKLTIKNNFLSSPLGSFFADAKGLVEIVNNEYTDKKSVYSGFVTVTNDSTENSRFSWSFIGGLILRNNKIYESDLSDELAHTDLYYPENATVIPSIKFTQDTIIGVLKDDRPENSIIAVEATASSLRYSYYNS